MNILCFGDSNTWGANPAGGRFPREIRWTGYLQALLGSEYYVIEHGVCGSTTVFKDPTVPGRRSIDDLPNLLAAHQPLDIIIMMLGTNDCKSFFNASDAVIARGLQSLIETVRRYPYSDGAAPQILLIAPPPLGEQIEQCPFVGYDRQSLQKSKGLAVRYQALAVQFNCHFFDAGTVTCASQMDQVHVEASGHAAIAQAVAAMLKK